MRNVFKRILAMTLTVLMIFSMFVFSAGAEVGDTQTEKITPDTSWYDAGQSEYVLYDAADLLGFMELCKTNEPVSTHGAANRAQGGFWGGKTVKLGADIDLNPGWDATPTITEKEEEGKTVKTLTPPTAAPNVWTPVAYFGGTFDGQGHTISGLYINYDAPTTNVGMFARTGNDSMIKSFALTNSYVYGHLNTNNYLLIGSIVGCCINKVENIYSEAYVFCDVTDTNGAVQFINIGGISGKQYEDVSNCVFAGKLGVVRSRTDMILDTRYENNSQQVRLGGIIGCADDTLDGGSRAPALTNCLTLGGYHVMNSGDLGTSFKYAAFVPADSVENATITTCVDDAKNAAWLQEDANAAYTTDWEYNAFLGYVAPKAISANFSNLYLQKGTGDNAGAVRFLGLLKTDDISTVESATLKITMTYDGTTYTLNENIGTVYKAVKANAKTVYAASMCADYMYGVEVYGLEEATSDVTFTVENIVNGESVATATWTYSVS